MDTDREKNTVVKVIQKPMSNMKEHSPPQQVAFAGLDERSDSLERDNETSQEKSQQKTNAEGPWQANGPQGEEAQAEKHTISNILDEA